MTYEQIQYAVDARVATITLNRPEKLNAWTPTMERELREAIEAAGADEDVRAIVVTGAGRGFCAGADMDAMADALSGEASVEALPSTSQDTDDNFNQALSYPLQIPKPVIAAINGAVAGIGLAFTLYCDIRLIAPQAKVTTAFARRGLIAEYGSAWMLPRLIGPMQALDWLMSARVLRGHEAAAQGFATLIDGDDFAATAQAYAAELAQLSSPRSMAVIKRQVWGGQFQSLAEASQLAQHEMFESFKSEDFREGVAHFLERREPRFSGK